MLLTSVPNASEYFTCLECIFIRDTGAPWASLGPGESQGEPGGARRSQEAPGGARRSQEAPGGAKWILEGPGLDFGFLCAGQEPGGARETRRSQGEAGGAPAPPLGLP